MPKHNHMVITNGNKRLDEMDRKIESMAERLEWLQRKHLNILMSHDDRITKLEEMHDFAEPVQEDDNEKT